MSVNSTNRRNPNIPNIVTQFNNGLAAIRSSLSRLNLSRQGSSFDLRSPGDEDLTGRVRRKISPDKEIGEIQVGQIYLGEDERNIKIVDSILQKRGVASPLRRHFKEKFVDQMPKNEEAYQVLLNVEPGQTIKLKTFYEDIEYLVTSISKWTQNKHDDVRNGFRHQTLDSGEEIKIFHNGNYRIIGIQRTTPLIPTIELGIIDPDLIYLKEEEPEIFKALLEAREGMRIIVTLPGTNKPTVKFIEKIDEWLEDPQCTSLFAYGYGINRKNEKDHQIGVFKDGVHRTIRLKE